MWKLTRNFLLYALGILLLGVASLVIINGFKSEPSETSRVLAEVPANPYPDSDNVFLARSAINLPDRESRLTEAKNRVLLETAWYQARAHGKMTQEQLDTKLSTHAKIAFAKSVPWCNPARGPCLKEFAEQHDVITSSKANNALLLQRYLQLPDFKGSHDITPPNEYAAYSIGLIPELRLLFLAQVADAFLRGTVQERAYAMRQLAGDLVVWKKTLSGYSSLIDKMIATSYLHQSLALVGEIINHRDFVVERDGAAFASVLQDIAVPDVSGMWKHEYRFMHQLLESMDAQGAGSFIRPQEEDWDNSPSATRSLLNTIAYWFFDRADTQNRSADYFSQLIALSKLPPDQGLQALRALDGMTSNNSHAWWSYARNPLGKTLLASSGNLSSYQQRIYDVFAYQQMVLLSYQWRTQAMPATTASAQLNNNPLARHPATGSSFQYDPETRLLRMVPLQPHKERTFDVAVFSPVAP
jgi:hypothetical protein